LIVGIGLVLAALAALITTLLVTRVDGAMTALMVNADRIGRGAHPGPVQPSGVPEIAALERSLEHMRQALAGTTISRDYLDTLLNSRSDAVLVVAPDGRVRTANVAATRLFGLEPGSLIGREFLSLVAEQHRAAFSLERVLAGPGETVVNAARDQTIPVAVTA